MNKKELIKLLAKKFELTNTKTNEIISHLLESITDSLSKNKPVAFIGFGTFSVRKKKARNGRNPRTGETIKILARKAVHFTAGKALKDAVNKK